MQAVVFLIGCRRDGTDDSRSRSIWIKCYSSRKMRGRRDSLQSGMHRIDAWEFEAEIYGVLGHIYVEMQDALKPWYTFQNISSVLKYRYIEICKICIFRILSVV